MQDEIGRFYITKKPNDTTNARIIVHANSNKMFKRISYVFFFSSILKSMKILLKITSKAFTSLLIEGMPIFLNSIKSGIRVWSFFYAAQ